MFDRLSDTDTGRFYVHTEHSMYDVDLDERTLVRCPYTGKSADLRQDCQPVNLLKVVQCRVGHHAIFMLDGLAEHGPTSRLTTLVISIVGVA